MKLNSKIKNEFFQRYVFDYIGANMYLLVEDEKKSALVIDPHISREALLFLKNHNVEKLLILLTHEHYDHTNGVNYLYEQFDSRLCCQELAAKSIAVEKNNRPLVVAMRLKVLGEVDKLKKLMSEQKLYSCKSDITFENELNYMWHGHSIKMIHTPGHSKGSCCIEIDDKYVFTGDSMIPNEKVLTRFPGGDENVFEQITLPYLMSISNDKWVMPGHGEPVQRFKLKYRDGKFITLEK